MTELVKQTILKMKEGRIWQVVQDMDEGVFSYLRKRWYRVIVSFVIAGLFCFFSFALNVFLSSWDWEVVKTMDFNEPIRRGLFKQLLNSLSSLFFVFAGVYFWWRTEVRIRVLKKTVSQGELLELNRAFGFIYGTALILVGIGSFYFHASLTVLGGKLDFLSMFLLASALFAFSLLLLINKAKKEVFYLIFSVSSVVLLMNDLFFSGLYGREIFGMLLALSYCFALVDIFLKESHRFKRFAYWFCSIASLLLAKYFWNLDVNQGWWLGHSLWHAICAVSAYVVTPVFFIDWEN